MDIPRTEWSQEWAERDIKQIKQLAEQFRSQEPINDTAAWRAAEIEYVARFRPLNWKGRIHARKTNKAQG